MREVVYAAASATVVLVEGESDRLALGALAERLGVDLGAADATVVPMDGVSNLRHHLAALERISPRPRVLGLFDRGEAAHVRRVLEDAGLAHAGADLEELGFFACDP